MSETALWHMVKDKLASRAGKWMRVDNPCLPGTADVHYCVDGVTGWIELKEIEKLPVREKTPVRIPHFTKEQRLWLWDYHQAGGTAHLLLRIQRPKTYLLFAAMDAYNGLGDWPWDQLREEALILQERTFPTELIWDTLDLPRY